MSVPIFYLHFRADDQIISDLEGVELPDLAAARKQAMHAARELMSFEVIRGKLNLDQSIQIHASSGESLGSVEFAEAVSIRGGPRLDDGRRQQSVVGTT